MPSFLIASLIWILSSVDYKNEDTCKLQRTQIVEPFADINYYADYYDKFKSDSTSDYQLICIAVPDDDTYGSVVYMRMIDGVCTTETGNYLTIKKEFHRKNYTDLLDKLNGIEKGGYICMCDLYSIRHRYNICIIKKKGCILFQYEGINKYITELSQSQSLEIKNVISLLREIKQ